MCTNCGSLKCLLESYNVNSVLEQIGMKDEVRCISRDLAFCVLIDYNSGPQTDYERAFLNNIDYVISEAKRFNVTKEDVMLVLEVVDSIYPDGIRFPRVVGKKEAKIKIPTVNETLLLEHLPSNNSLLEFSNNFVREKVLVGETNKMERISSNVNTLDLLESIMLEEHTSVLESMSSVNEIPLVNPTNNDIGRMMLEDKSYDSGFTLSSSNKSRSSKIMESILI
jgi:hypothetical protein